MTDRNSKRLNELLSQPGNDECADCGLKGSYYQHKEQAAILSLYANILKFY